MSLCPHGYTASWDCPVCECPGCGRTQDGCVCHMEPRPEYHGAAGPVAKPDFSEVTEALEYLSYITQRMNNPEIAPERWAKIGFKNVPEMEARFQAEMAVKKAQFSSEAP